MASEMFNFMMILTSRTHILTELFLVLICPTLIDTDCTSSIGDSDTRMTSYSTEITAGITRCGKLCALEGRCIAINYHTDTLTCEMVENDAVVAQDSTGWTYISDMSFVSHLLDACSGETMSEYQVCINLTSGNRIVVIKYCPEITSVTHGTIPTSPRVVGTTVTYTCDTGYVGFGSASRSCGANGQWKGSTFECRDCGAPPTVLSGVVLPGNTTVGSDRFYLCGTFTSPDANAFVTCENNGLWSTPSFSCVCPDPPTVPNSTPSTDQRTAGTILDFTCDSGYIAVGTSRTTCQSNGTWSAMSFMCTDCGEPPVVTGATVQSGTNLVGSNRYYLCDGENSVRSSNYVTCLNDISWTTTNILCGIWPYGVYSLLQPTAGCPLDFHAGQRTWNPEAVNGMSSTNNNFLAGYTTGSYVQWHFCTKTDPIVNDGTSSWPAGTYCIMMYAGACPSGFTSGSLYFDEEDTNHASRPTAGTLPTMIATSDSELFFCCRSDGSTNTAILLQKDTPFVLFAYQLSTCQNVQGMTSASGYTYFDNEDNNNIDKATGAVPYAEGPPNWRIYYCLYS